jgi:hypothetical protein
VPFLASAAVLAAAYGVGSALTWNRLRLEDRLLRTLTTFAIGFAALSLLVLGLGLAGAFDRPVLVAVALGGLALLVPFARAELRDARAARRGRVPVDPLLGATAAIVAFCALLASAPPTSGDAIAYHLAAPKEWTEAGEIFPLWWSWVSFQPFSVQMHYALAQALDGGGAAMVVGALLGGFSAACVYGLARSLAGARVGAAAALIWVAQGMFVWEATGAFVELVLSGFVALAAWHLVELHRSGRLVHAALAGLCVGLAAATKYHGLVFVPALAAVVAALVPRGRRLAALAAFGALAAVALPWYARNWVVTGNPVYPFFSDLLGGRYVDDAAQYDLDQSLASYGGAPLWRLPVFPLEFALRTEAYERGWSFSPALFLLAPLALGAGRVARVLALGIVVYLVVWWEAMHQITRYLLPACAFAAVLAGWAAVRLWERRGWGRRYVLAVAAATVVPFVAITGLFAWRTLPGAIGLESTAEHVQRQTGTYDAFEWLDEELPPEGRVLVGIRNLYWLDRPHAAYDLPVFNFGISPEVAEARLRRFDVRYLAFLDGALPSPLEPLRPRLRELARLDAPFVSSRTLARVEERELVVWAWCGARPDPCEAGGP